MNVCLRYGRQGIFLSPSGATGLVIEIQLAALRLAFQMPVPAAMQLSSIAMIHRRQGGP